MFDAIELCNDNNVSYDKLLDLLTRCKKCLSPEDTSISELCYNYFSRDYLCTCLKFIADNVKALSSTSIEELELKLAIRGF